MIKDLNKNMSIKWREREGIQTTRQNFQREIYKIQNKKCTGQGLQLIKLFHKKETVSSKTQQQKVSKLKNEQKDLNI